MERFSFIEVEERGRRYVIDNAGTEELIKEFKKLPKEAKRNAMDILSDYVYEAYYPMNPEIRTSKNFDFENEKYIFFDLLDELRYLGSLVFRDFGL